MKFVFGIGLIIFVGLLPSPIYARIALFQHSDKVVSASRVNVELGVSRSPRELGFTENLFAGGVSRACAQAVCHPLNVAKTLLQASGSSGTVVSMRGLSSILAASPRTFTRGIGAQIFLSIPNGALNFATLEFARGTLSRVIPKQTQRRVGPALDLLSSACGTLLASVISVPQTVLLDRIMAGIYPNVVQGAVTLGRTDGLRGFYRGWQPAMGSKIPSYALTWANFQYLKRIHRAVTKRESTNNMESFVLGAISSACTVLIMIPMDTIKTRLTTQAVLSGAVQYKGIVDCYRSVVQTEGIGALYRALPPRLMSVVPMMGIQLCVYDCVRKELLRRDGKSEGR
uniref:Uncharacterized protein n=1 Tax=Octactis speculum TaxID=3111310 RepID=A0A7S2FHF1_9STRA|mmetsp:Transcript_22383/g.30592  ORF Transcript_22383/g.30592 Transcript_22383/m.30592 type:complete len:342 (+) Transcript_22383:119-1144(+)